MTASGACVLFTIEGCSCALPADSVLEVLPFPSLFRPPGTPRVVAGFLNLGGQAVAVIDGVVLFEPGSTAKPLRDRADQHLLLLAVEASLAPVALAVDRVLDVATIPIIEAASESENRLPQEASTLRFRHEGEVVHLLSVNGLLRLEERARLGELSEQAQKRLADWEDVP